MLIFLGMPRGLTQVRFEKTKKQKKTKKLTTNVRIEWRIFSNVSNPSLSFFFVCLFVLYYYYYYYYHH